MVTSVFCFFVFWQILKEKLRQGPASRMSRGSSVARSVVT